MDGKGHQRDCILPLQDALTGNLPPVCVQCGGATNNYSALALQHRWKLIVLHLPICPNHKNDKRWQSQLMSITVCGLVLALVGVVVAAVSYVSPGPTSLIGVNGITLAALFVAALGAFLFIGSFALGFYLVLFPGGLQIRQMNEKDIILTNIAPEFEKALQDYDQESAIPDQDPMVVQFDATLDDFVDAALRADSQLTSVQVWRRKDYLAGMVVNALVPGLGLYLLFPGSQEVRLFLSCFGAIIGASFYPFFYRKNIRDRYRKYYREVLGSGAPSSVEITLSHQGIFCKQKTGMTNYDWPRVKEIHETPDSIDFIMHEVGIVVVRKRGFASEDAKRQFLEIATSLLHESKLIPANVMASQGTQTQEIPQHYAQGDLLANLRLRLSDEVLTVVEIAEQEARRLHHDYLGTEHLLLGLVANPIPAAEILQRFSTNPERLREVIERSAPASTKAEPAGKLTYTTRVRRTLEHSVMLAEVQECDSVNVRHLLLGLLHEQDGQAVQTLLVLGIDVNELKTQSLNSPAKGP